MAKRTDFNKSIIEKEESIFAEFAEIAFVVLVALVIAVILRTQVSMVRGVDGVSMQNTYNSAESGYKGYGIYDTVRITRIGSVRRGDVVTFESNLKDGKDGYKILIKRVIGVGGDKLEFRAGADKIGSAAVLEVWRNGVRLDEPYIKRDGNGTPLFTKHGDRPLNEPFIVKKGFYFVMGDNRDNSTDSRSNSVGVVPFKKIEGKVYLTVHEGDNYVSALWNKVFN